MASDSDRLLIAQIRQGDERAWQELIERYEGRLLAFAIRRLRDRATAEDVVQSTWLTLVRSADSITSPQAVAGWLCTTARREAWRMSKRVRRETPAEETTLAAVLPDIAAPESEVVLDDEKRRLWQCVSRLNERCQALLRIAAAGPRPDYAEISRSLGMPVGSIGPTRARCLEKLKAELVADGGLA